MYRLKEAIISITNRCNLRCRMCDIPRGDTKELPASAWKDFIKDAAKVGARTVVFSGGEPLLRDDIFELIGFVKNNYINACLTSNGCLINEETASKLFSSGIDVVNISIEGPEEIHDYLRGGGAFRKAVAALENLRKFNIESTIAVMVSRYNYKHLPYIADLAKQYGATTIKLQPFSRIFLQSNRSPDEFFTSESDISAMDKIIKEFALLCGNYNIVTNPQGYLEKIPEFLAQKYLTANQVCGAVWDSCSVNSKGEIYPCWVLTDREKLIGSLSEERFWNLWNSPRRKSILENLKKNSCAGCMMSCYDDNFGKDNFERYIRRARNKGLKASLKLIAKKIRKRARFYASYRGPISALIKRALKKKIILNLEADKKEIEDVLREIAIAKRALEEEIGS